MEKCLGEKETRKLKVKWTRGNKNVVIRKADSKSMETKKRWKIKAILMRPSEKREKRNFRWKMLFFTFSLKNPRQLKPYLATHITLEALSPVKMHRFTVILQWTSKLHAFYDNKASTMFYDRLFGRQRLFKQASLTFVNNFELFQSLSKLISLRPPSVHPGA